LPAGLAVGLSVCLFILLFIFHETSYDQQQPGIDRLYREIGIRKVLGCSLTGITALLSKDFIRLVMIAILIASPLAWFAMNRWLQDFSYRVPIHWWLFVIAGCLAVGIALVTVCFQASSADLRFRSPGPG
jgi:putative ABC transport system permease protein